MASKPTMPPIEQLEIISITDIPSKRSVIYKLIAPANEEEASWEWELQTATPPEAAPGPPSSKVTDEDGDLHSLTSGEIDELTAGVPGADTDLDIPEWDADA